MEFEVLRFILLRLNKLIAHSWYLKGYLILFVFLSDLIMSTRKQQCVNNFGVFCYICGYFTLIRQRYNIKSFVKRAYKAYFGLTLDDQDITAKKSCVTGRKGKVMAYLSESKEHTISCYFCLVYTKGTGKKNRHKNAYPSIPSAIQPSLHSDELPVLVFTEFSPSKEESIDEMQETNDIAKEILTDSDEHSNPTSKLSTPQQFSQAALNDLVHDLGLSKNAAEIFCFLAAREDSIEHNHKFYTSEIGNRFLWNSLKRRISLFIVIIPRIFSGN